MSAHDPKLSADDTWQLTKDMMAIADDDSDSMAYPDDAREVRVMIDVASNRAFLRRSNRRNAMVTIYGLLDDLLNDEEKTDVGEEVL